MMKKINKKNKGIKYSNVTVPAIKKIHTTEARVERAVVWDSGRQKYCSTCLVERRERPAVKGNKHIHIGPEYTAVIVPLRRKMLPAVRIQCTAVLYIPPGPSWSYNTIRYPVTAVASEPPNVKQPCTSPFCKQTVTINFLQPLASCWHRNLQVLAIY